MLNKTHVNAQKENIKFSITKIFKASPEKLYNAFLDSNALKRVWGVQSIKVNPKVGGKAEAKFMIDNVDWSFVLTYLEMKPGKKLKWKADFNKYPNKKPVTTLTFKKVKEGTEFNVTQEYLETTDDMEGGSSAWTSGLENLKVFLGE